MIHFLFVAVAVISVVIVLIRPLSLPYLTSLFMRLLITEIVTAHFLHIFFIPLYFNLTTTEIMPRFLPRKKVLLALSPYLQDDSLAFPGPFLNLFIESQKATKRIFVMKYTFCFYSYSNYGRPNRPMHFDFFRVKYLFFVHPLCGKVARFSRSIVIIICTSSDFFSR